MRASILTRIGFALRYTSFAKVKVCTSVMFLLNLIPLIQALRTHYEHLRSNLFNLANRLSPSPILQRRDAIVAVDTRVSDMFVLHL